MPDGPTLIAVMDTVNEMFFSGEVAETSQLCDRIHVQSDNDQNYAVEPSQLRCHPLLSKYCLWSRVTLVCWGKVRLPQTLLVPGVLLA